MRRALASAALAFLLLACRAQPQPSEAAERSRPRLSLLTSLPLVFGEDFSLDGAKHPLFVRLEKDFDVRLIDGPEELERGGLLLAAQPQALTAERLVALDAWVRKGGRMILLADPRFTWDSSRPLGDKGRPPYSFPDTGLLQHWGLRLESYDPPELEDVERRIGDARVPVASPGVLVPTGHDCRVQPDAFVARCALGRGEAVVIADADFVMRGVPESFDAVASELEKLKR